MKTDQPWLINYLRYTNELNYRKSLNRSPGVLFLFQGFQAGVYLRRAFIQDRRLLLQYTWTLLLPHPTSLALQNETFTFSTIGYSEVEKNRKSPWQGLPPVCSSQSLPSRVASPSSLFVSLARDPIAPSPVMARCPRYHMVGPLCSGCSQVHHHR